ncbi:hypothetical protein LZ009_06130 [Ramlibacter sp. XY19]|uniref:hypothetical protein n=1 Tax=Ramlibacter paludis TaxID=2908000 RepID=UPI0023DA48E3|nr:hypothetical protein [Ramlibacter paludis]MCG2592356.1 hypothetical protein [Ramlibacter paludis]
MPHGKKSAPADQPKDPRTPTVRPEAEARARAAAHKLHSGSGNFGKARKVPFGPVGGSGRKTNLSRSS